MTKLPSDTTLNIAPLVKAFRNVAASYKFLWMLGILDVLKKKSDTDNGTIRTWDIVEKMLMIADAPLNRFHLFFGAGDKMKEHVEKWQNAKQSGTTETEKALMEIHGELMQYVPMLFISPFFEQKVELPKGNYARRKKIRELAMDYFFDTDTRPLYRMGLKPKPTCIEIHPEWLKYLLCHSEIIRGWVNFHWISYLQARNPFVPSIIDKIACPDKRKDMRFEREWWGEIIQQNNGVECIYSDTPILPGDDFQLDHYVPWSHVMQNRLWNLIPVMGFANASKSDHLPKHEKYFEKFVQIQYDALQASQYICGDYEDITGTYSDDLKIEIEPPPEMGKLSAAYNIVIPSLIDLARIQGFSEWEYKPRLNSRKINL